MENSHNIAQRFSQEIKQSIDTPDDVIFDYFQEYAFPNQALGRTILGPKENVRSFTPEILYSYMKTNYAANNTVVVAVGNIKHNTFVDIFLLGWRTSTSNISRRFLYRKSPN